MNDTNQVVIGCRNFLKKFPIIFAFCKKVYLFLLHLGTPFKWRAIARRPSIKLELGSGIKKGVNGWTTVDLYGADINCDLRHGIPLKDRSVDAIYASHLFEHIPFPSLVRLLIECRRLLKPGGYISVCVPNARLYIEAYCEKRRFGEGCDFYMPYRIDTGSFLDQVNYIAYMGGEHAYLFDEENLVNTIKLAGYSSVELREFDGQIDAIERRWESIYAIASK